MIIRPEYIIYAIFAYMSSASDAIIYTPIGRYKNTETKYQPGRAIGEFFGSMILHGIKRNQMKQADLDPKDVRNVNPEYDNEYNKEPSLLRPGYDNTPKTDDSDYNGRYDSREYTHDDSIYQVNNDVHDSGNSYRDPTSDVIFVTNPNGTPIRVSEAGYNSGIDDNIPLEPLIPPRQEEIPEDDNMYEMKINNDNENGKVKALTVTTFTFQAQPIKPENERNISMIAVYYID